MLNKIAGCLVAGTVLLGAASTASAQQTLNFNLGYFTLRGEDARTGAGCTSCGKNVDVLIANRDFLTFNVDEFNGASVGAEWLFPIGQFIDGGAGSAFPRRTVPRVDTDSGSRNRTEVEQALRLRRIPIDLTVRALPLGQTSPVQPYVGVGLSIINWRYSESGEFIDFNAPTGRPGEFETFRDTFAADGTATGPVALFGIRFSSDVFSVGGEARYHKADGEVGEDFAGTKIDLGGWTYQATFGVRFGS